MTDVGLVTVMALALALAMAMALAMYISVRHTALVHENKRLLGDAFWLREYCAELEQDMQDNIAQDIRLGVRRAALMDPARIRR